MPFLPPHELGLGDPSAEQLQSLESLERVLADDLPERKPNNLLIATWNIKVLGRVTKAWEANEDDSPKRNLYDLCAIAAVISRFDVVAVVEVRRDLEALKLVLKILGPDWGYIVSNVTEGDAGNDERLGYVFNFTRVKPSGMAGELVIPDEELDETQAVLNKQFVRTPYTVSFAAGENTAFTLVSLHIFYGTSDRPQDRAPELAGFARWMHDHADDEDEFNRNLIALGDFNIDRYDDVNWQAFVIDNGLGPPKELLDLPRTVGDTTDKHSHFDQIAWFNDGQKAALTLDYVTAGTFVWDKYLHLDLPIRRKEARISDHYPLWAEFGLSP